MTGSTSRRCLPQKFTADLSSYIYFGYPRASARAPTFMHDSARWINPTRQSAIITGGFTHITFGVATLSGLKTVKVEGSIFTGREPTKIATISINRVSIPYSGRISEPDPESKGTASFSRLFTQPQRA